MSKESSPVLFLRHFFQNAEQNARVHIRVEEMLHAPTTFLPFMHNEGLADETLGQ